MLNLPGRTYCRPIYNQIFRILVVGLILFLIYELYYNFTKEEYLINKGIEELDRIERIKDDPFLKFQPVPMKKYLNKTKRVYPWGKDPYRTEEKCRDKVYDLKTLPKASVIICFHETERFDNLIHTVHSVIQNSPKELLEEVIVIDDNSHKDIHGIPLSNYLKNTFHGLVKILRNSGPKLLGVIKGRLKGIQAAKAPVAVVIDSHMEARNGWLEPLLYEIAKDKRTLAAITLDWMKEQSDGSWVYEIGPSNPMIAWAWADLWFTLWQQKSKKEENRLQTDPTQPFRMPCTVGHWAIDREFFEEIGALDEGMQYWGGENIDIAIRTYLWNGQVLGIPCSHVAHIESYRQRDYRYDFNYDFSINYKRIVDVWFDDYKEVFYYFNPDAKTLDSGDLAERFSVKKRSPNSIDFYFKEAYPELGNPLKNTFAFGELHCIGAPGQTMVWMKQFDYGLKEKTLDPLNYVVFLTDDLILRTAVGIFTIEDEGGALELKTYTLFQEHEPRKFIHAKGSVLKSVDYDLCLQADKNRVIPVLANCDPTDVNQQWIFTNYTRFIL